MSGFKNIKAVVDATQEGRVREYFWRKTPSQTTGAGRWFDLSMSPGMPPPKYWFDAPPLIAKAVSRSADGGIDHGPNVSPAQKHILGITALASVSNGLPLPLILCDYLLYYPSIDDSVTDPQVLDNSVTLPRYTDGEGVQAIAVTVAGRTGGQTFSFSYTNQDGVAGRTSRTCYMNTVSAIGTITTSEINQANAMNPFIGLQDGDSGIRSIETVTMNAADVGLFALILVKPLLLTQVLQITVPYEKNTFIQDMTIPRVYDDAFLGLIGLPRGTLATTALQGSLKVIWN